LFFAVYKVKIFLIDTGLVQSHL